MVKNGAGSFSRYENGVRNRFGLNSVRMLYSAAELFKLTDFGKWILRAFSAIVGCNAFLPYFLLHTALTQIEGQCEGEKCDRNAFAA